MKTHHFARLLRAGTRHGTPRPTVNDPRVPEARNRPSNTEQPALANRHRCWYANIPSRLMVYPSMSNSISSAGSSPRPHPSCPGPITTTCGATNSAPARTTSIWAPPTSRRSPPSAALQGARHASREGNFGIHSLDSVSHEESQFRMVHGCTDEGRLMGSNRVGGRNACLQPVSGNAVFRPEPTHFSPTATNRRVGFVSAQ